MKTTARCNAECDYCSAQAAGPDAAVPSLRLELAVSISKQAAGLVEQGRFARVNIIWHGGEPLLLGKRFFTELSRFARPGQVSHQIQTNLLLLDEEWLDILEPLIGRDGIGTSCDPVSNSRRYRGRPAVEDWTAKARFATERGWRLGCVFVGHAANMDDPASVYWFFRNLADQSRVSLRVNPIIPVGLASGGAAAHLLPRAGKFGEFLCQLARQWVSDGRRLAISPLNNLWEYYRGRNPELPCDMAGETGCVAVRCGVDADGRVYSCGRAYDSGAESFGSLETTPLEVLLSRRREPILHGRGERLLRGECGDCAQWELCHGGCPYEHSAAHAQQESRTRYCDDRRAIAEYVRKMAVLPERLPATPRTSHPATLWQGFLVEAATPADLDRVRTHLTLGECVTMKVPIAFLPEAIQSLRNGGRLPHTVIIALDGDPAGWTDALRKAALPAPLNFSVPSSSLRDNGEGLLTAFARSGHALFPESLLDWEAQVLYKLFGVFLAADGAGAVEPFASIVRFNVDPGFRFRLSELCRVADPVLMPLPRRCKYCPAFKFCRGLLLVSKGRNDLCAVLVESCQTLWPLPLSCGAVAVVAQAPSARQSA